MDSCTLYYRPTCPYCLNVLRFIKGSGITIPLKDITEPENHAYLLRNGKVDQVPCLFVNEVPIYESEVIIAFLEKRSSE